VGGDSNFAFRNQSGDDSFVRRERAGEKKAEMEDSRGFRGGLRSAFLISTLPFQRASGLKSRVSWKGKLPGFSSSVVSLSKKKGVTTKSNAKLAPSLSPAFTDSNGFGKGPAGGKVRRVSCLLTFEYSRLALCADICFDVLYNRVRSS